MNLEGISPETVSLGDMDHVSLEAVAALEPDMMILFSTDPAQKALGEAAEGIGLNVFYGVRIVACQMSMDIMGIHKEELLDGVELGGVSTFLGSGEQSDMSLFI